MGKSRLVEELIAHAKRRDARVLLGRAYESDQILLFGPVVDALRTGRVGQDPEVLDALGPAWRAELARLLPEVAAPDAPPLPARVDYRRLFEMIAQLIAHLAARDTLLLVLEDLHWADELTLRLLAFLARRTPTERVLLVVTAREEELPDAAMLRHTLEDLGRAGLLASLGLGPLSRRDTVALVARLTPPGAAARTERLGERVWTVSEGNPLVVVEMMREIQERAPAEGLTLPRRAREVIGRRLERLADRSAVTPHRGRGDRARVRLRAAASRVRAGRRGGRAGGGGARPPAASSPASASDSASPTSGSARSRSPRSRPGAAHACTAASPRRSRLSMRTAYLTSGKPWPTTGSGARPGRVLPTIT